LAEPSQNLTVNLPDCSPTNAGGVAIFVMNELACKPETELQFKLDDCENVFVSIKASNSKLVIGTVYKHLKTDVKLFLEKLKQTMHTLNSQRLPTKCILVGDYSINLMTSDCPAVTSYINTLRRNAFFSAITLPTRVTENSTAPCSSRVRSWICFLTAPRMLDFCIFWIFSLN